MFDLFLVMNAAIEILLPAIWPGVFGVAAMSCVRPTLSITKSLGPSDSNRLLWGSSSRFLRTCHQETVLIMVA